jgi:hypothetical protein
VALDFTPIEIDSSAVDEVELVTLFVIDDVPYQIPKRLRPAAAITYLRDVREKGPEVALADALAEVLGEDAMDALADCDAITDEQMGQIMGAVQRLLTGAMERASGKSRAARRR